MVVEGEGYRLYRGDCLPILQALSDCQFDLALFDPPYGIGENQRRVLSREQLAKPIDYGVFTWDSTPAGPEAITHARRVSRQQIIWGGNYYDLPPSSCWLVWDKENTGDFADCELAWTNLPKAVRIFRHMWNGFLRASERDTRRVHPTQKPVALMKWCIEQVRQVRSIIDPFMGSSPVGVAAVQAGIYYTGIEIDPCMFDMAHRRIEDASRAARGLPKQLTDTATHTDLPLFAEVER